MSLKISKTIKPVYTATMFPLDDIPVFWGQRVDSELFLKVEVVTCIFVSLDVPIL